MPDEFVMRGKTASGGQEVLNFSGYKPGYGYRMTEFQIYPSADIGAASAQELMASVTAAKTFEDPQNPNFNNEGLIATSFMTTHDNPAYVGMLPNTVINDTYIITQNLIIAVLDAQSGSPRAVNWQCRFKAVKMSGPQEAATNYKQYLVSDGSQ